MNFSLSLVKLITERTEEVDHQGAVFMGFCVDFYHSFLIKSICLSCRILIYTNFKQKQLVVLLSV